ncbi:MAG: type II toxin-antitoxin system HigB family toxin [Paludibacteraceae bacterium]|nr:type II toxin-antitoxin system HigB family toxin [Paludibacteraceae bacterium]
MRVISRKTLITYYSEHPQAKDALEEWYNKTNNAEWHNLSDIRNTFNSVDYAGNQHYVFNIKGNDFRLVVVIKFSPMHVYTRFVGTHAEYDRIADIKNI